MFFSFIHRHSDIKFAFFTIILPFVFLLTGCSEEQETQRSHQCQPADGTKLVGSQPRGRKVQAVVAAADALGELQLEQRACREAVHRVPEVPQRCWHRASLQGEQ